jgi:hypothetical protein
MLILFNLRLKCSRNILCKYINNIKVNPFTPRRDKLTRIWDMRSEREGAIIFDKKDFPNKNATKRSYCIYLWVYVSNLLLCCCYYYYYIHVRKILLKYRYCFVCDVILCRYKKTNFAWPSCFC